MTEDSVLQQTALRKIQLRKDKKNRLKKLDEENLPAEVVIETEMKALGIQTPSDNELLDNHESTFAPGRRSNGEGDVE